MISFLGKTLFEGVLVTIAYWGTLAVLSIVFG